jgi:hypothetical protein
LAALICSRQKGNGERDIGKRKLQQENSKRKELKKKNHNPVEEACTFWTQEPARMKDD